MLKIEGENVSAVEVAFHMEELRATIALQQTEDYLSPNLKAEIDLLIDSGDFDETTIKDVFRQFYGK